MDALLSDPVGLLLFACGALLGLVVGILSSRRASRELQAEAARLRQLHHLTLIALEEAGIADVKRDEQGYAIGINIFRSAQPAVSSSKALDASVGNRS